MLNAFWRVAPSVRFRDLAIFPAGIFLRASDFNSRTWSAVQARLFFDPFFIRICSPCKGRVLVALSLPKGKARTRAAMHTPRSCSRLILIRERPSEWVLADIAE